MSGVVDLTNKELIDFNSGDTVRIFYKIIEGGKSRVQPFEGIVISKKGTGVSKTFTVRRIGADNIGVERIFPLYSPMIEKVEVVKRSKVRRAKLYYIKDKAVKEINKRLKMQMIRGEKPTATVAAPDNDLLDETPEEIDMDEVKAIEESEK
jgi:large subunit ribosomal protein L19